MKLRQFSVSNVLHYDNFTVDMGHAPFHVLYGPNETGKTTLLNLLIDWLYGGVIQDTFRDHYDSRSLLEGIIENEAGQPANFGRKKHYSRLELRDTTLSEDDLQHYLASYDKDRFMLLFGLDHERLREGGNSLMQSGGHAGVSLFEAGGGVQHLHNLLMELNQRAGQLLDPSFRSTSAKLLNKQWKKFLEAEKKIRQDSLRSDEWQQQKESIAALESEIQGIRQQRQELNREWEKARRLQRVKTMLPELAEIREAIRQLGSVNVLTDNDEADIENRLRDYEGLTQRISLQEQQLQQQQHHSDELIPEPELLTMDFQIVKISQALTQYETRQNDELPKLRQAYQQIDNDIAFRVQLLVGNAATLDVDALRIPYADMKRAARIIEDLNRAQSDTRQKQERYEDSLRDHRQKQTALEKTGRVFDVSGFRKTINQMRQAGNLDDKITEAANSIEAERLSLEHLLKTQTIYVGRIEDLVNLPLPLEATLSRFQTRWDSLQEQDRELRREHTRVEDKLRTLTHDLEKLELGGHVPIESDLTWIRQQRDQVWQWIKRSWLLGEDVSDEASSATPGQPLPQAFEISLRQADDIADQLRKEADKSAQRALLLLDKEQAERQAQQIHQRLEDIHNAFRSTQDAWQQEWKAAGITAKRPAEMKEWITGTYRVLVQGWKSLAAHEAELAHAKAQHAEFQINLKEVAAAHHLDLPDLGLADQLDLCEDYVREMERTQQEAHNYRQDLDLIAIRLQNQKQDLTRCESQVMTLQEQWEQLRAQYPLLPAEPDIAASYLQQVDELLRLDQRRGEMAQEIATKEGDCRRFEQDAHHLAGQMGESPQRFASLDAWISYILKRLDHAKYIDSQRQQLSDQIRETQEELEHLKKMHDGVHGVLVEWADHYQYPEVGHLRELISQSRTYKQAQAALEGLEHKIREAGDGLPLGAIELEFSQIEHPEDLAYLAKELENRLNDLSGHEDTQKERLKEMQIQFQALSGDRSDAAQDAQKAQYHLAEIDRLWTEYLRVELARRLLQGAIETYRQQNESSIVGRAENFFRRLTLNHYVHLMVEYDHNDPYLEAEDASGHRRRATQMSDGTRDQLYLALRLAFISQHLEQGEPLPLILDDILVNFDDERTQATLEVLNELAERTQILYFTHHQLVVDLAERLRPRQAKIHYLAQLV